MKKWKIKDKINHGDITYNVGDEVILVRRKQNGYPHRIKDGEVYIVNQIENDFLLIAQHSSDGIGFINHAKIHKTYFCNKSLLRDIKIDEILKQK